MSIRIKINNFFLKILYNIRHTILRKNRLGYKTKLGNYVLNIINDIIDIIEMSEY